MPSHSPEDGVAETETNVLSGAVERRELRLSAFSKRSECTNVQKGVGDAGCGDAQETRP